MNLKTLRKKIDGIDKKIIQLLNMRARITVDVAKIKQKSGLIFGCFLTLLFLARFIIEFFKENQEVFENNMLINMGQILSIPFILIGLTLIIWKSKSKIEYVEI